jgi:ATP-binding cassette subfamily F protein uup
MLGDYAGTVLLISHDRDFLDRVVNGVIVPEGGGRWAEYAGGYTDMLAQRGEDIAREATGKPARPRELKGPQSPSAAAEPKPGRRRLSFNEKYALETLPGEIASLQEKIRAAQEKLADASLYARDRKAFDEISAALVADQEALAAAEDRWLELEILREELGGG